MLIKSESRCPQFVANDGCKVRELMHPKNDGIDLAFSLAIAEVEPGNRTFRHRLSQTEVYYIVSGTGVVHIGNEQQRVTSGDAVLIGSSQVQWIENIGFDTLKFAALVSPPWRPESDENLEI
ncbi:MAG TPA: cupin domain-containing protein [Gammaproteobacteria bacterium]|nr:cupin domain-containing protein [Gammaproteobacteria bacterium]|tara:strand:+ start:429 stop:794 length:366 start_codon:yes stop_codon:yes gene_type:complete